MQKALSDFRGINIPKATTQPFEVHDPFPDVLQDAIKHVFRTELLDLNIKTAHGRNILVDDSLKYQYKDEYTAIRVDCFPPYFVPLDQNWKKAVRMGAQILKRGFSEW